VLVRFTNVSYNLTGRSCGESLSWFWGVPYCHEALVTISRVIILINCCIVTRFMVDMALNTTKRITISKRTTSTIITLTIIGIRRRMTCCFWEKSLVQRLWQWTGLVLTCNNSKIVILRKCFKNNFDEIMMQNGVCNKDQWIIDCTNAENELSDGAITFTKISHLKS
jgi:hypothetical protein